MKNQVFLLSRFLISFLLTASLAQAGEFLRSASPENIIPNEFIVVFKDSKLLTAPDIKNKSIAEGNKLAAQRAISSVGRSFNAEKVQAFDTVFRGAVFKMNNKTALQMAKNDLVEFIEPVVRVTGHTTQSNPTWGLDRIDQTDANLNRQYVYNSKAANVNVYVIDSGVSKVPDFEGRVRFGYDFVDNDYDSSDCHGHGTHVAGTIASKTYGVAKGAEVYGVRVLGCDNTGSTADIVAGMEWVAQNHIKPAVANMSLGSYSHSPAIERAADNLVDAGVITVVSAGNENSNACDHSPASSSKVITVGSTTEYDQRSYFSNTGSCVNIFAPGSSITSTSMQPYGGTMSMSGTSMASPHVAGAAALYLATSPNAMPSQVTSAILSSATKNAISDVRDSPNLMLYSRVEAGSENGYVSDVTLEIVIDNYGYETDWLLKDSEDNIIESGGDYARNSQHKRVFKLASGQYTFTINDDYGDGLASGNGYYTLTDGNNDLIVTGSNFGSTESTTFTIGGSDSNQKAAVTMELQIDRYGYETDWSLNKKSGPVIANGGDYAPHTKVIETFTLEDGNYVFTITDDYGDGLLNDGFYKLSINSGTTIVFGNRFGRTKTTEFTIVNGDLQ